jgi:hypothetical protein
MDWSELIPREMKKNVHVSTSFGGKTLGLRGKVGWLYALSDKQMSAAISSMHDGPAHDWTVEELGWRAGMSRSTLALSSKRRLGRRQWST